MEGEGGVRVLTPWVLNDPRESSAASASCALLLLLLLLCIEVAAADDEVCCAIIAALDWSTSAAARLICRVHTNAYMLKMSQFSTEPTAVARAHSNVH